MHGMLCHDPSLVWNGPRRNCRCTCICLLAVPLQLHKLLNAVCVSQLRLLPPQLVLPTQQQLLQALPPAQQQLLAVLLALQQPLADHPQILEGLGCYCGGLMPNMWGRVCHGQEMVLRHNKI